MRNFYKRIWAMLQVTSFIVSDEKVRYVCLAYRGVTVLALFMAKDREAWQTHELVTHYYANRTNTGVIK